MEKQPSYEADSQHWLGTKGGKWQWQSVEDSMEPMQVVLESQSICMEM